MAYKHQIKHERKKSQAPTVVEELKDEDDSSVQNTSDRVTEAQANTHSHSTN